MVEFILIVEGATDVPTAMKLAERVIIEKIVWVEEDDLQYQFSWRGLEDNTDHSRWSNLRRIFNDAKEAGIRLPKYIGHKRYGNTPLRADGAAAVKALNLVRRLQETRSIQAVVMIRDLDDQQTRRQGLEQARLRHTDEPPALEIVIGTADKMREAWVLNGFIPQNKKEEQTLASVTGKLGFDPCRESHRLRSTSQQEPDRARNPKVVLARLTGEDGARERECWEATDLNILRARGNSTGLTTYLQEVEERLVPILQPK